MTYAIWIVVGYALGWLGCSSWHREAIRNYRADMEYRRDSQ